MYSALLLSNPVTKKVAFTLYLSKISKTFGVNFDGPSSNVKYTTFLPVFLVVPILLTFLSGIEDSSGSELIEDDSSNFELFKDESSFYRTRVSSSQRRIYFSSGWNIF